jgi:acetoin utilization deacetylase AcuC-like enzyme
MKTGIVTDDSYLEHDTGAAHPERPDRLRAIGRLLRSEPSPDWIRIPARDASVEDLARIHVPEYVERVAATARLARFAFDADTPACARTFAAARRAAGGVLALVDAVMAGRVSNGFALVRPPGHHAERDRAMGFCFFNNVALAAAHLRAAHGLRRVLIVDWDVHHGNGTQHSFYRDPSVLFVSSHQYPFYPGTGAVREVGTGEGEGFTLNLPFPAGYGDAQYVQAFLDVVEPIARQFVPEFILVSAGFDAHRRDPLAGMDVTEDGFAKLARVLLRTARELCQDRLVAVLEGGYDLEGLTRSIAAVLSEMQGEQLGEPVSPPVGDRPDVRLPLEIARHYWRI